jgi:hypothetical protein
MVSRREFSICLVSALILAFVITRLTVVRPDFTDAYYHFNAAARLSTGLGLTDPYLWTYIGAPTALPAPSHLYWMPLTSLSAAAGMTLLSAPGDFAAAQIPFALMYAGTIMVAFWLGAHFGGRRHAWVAALLTCFSGFFMRYWGTTDTFGPYALIGSLCLVWLARAFESTTFKSIVGYCALAGVFSGLAHLTRADGVLFLMAGWSAIIWTTLFHRDQFRGKGRALAVGALVMVATYLITMSPWFIRNLELIGSPLPLGGTQTIWLTEYNDIFRFPSDNTPSRFFADGAGLLFTTRWEAFTNNLGHFIAVEGLIVMTPLMLIGLWQRRTHPAFRSFWIYALGLHLAMTFVFPYPGYRGGLLHSSAALIPWWAVLGVIGLDEVITWVANRRRRWNAEIAKIVYTGILVFAAVLLSVVIVVSRPPGSTVTPALYEAILSSVPLDARVMLNDPAALYYFTDRGGVVLPNNDPAVIPDIARQYNVQYLLLEGISADGLSADAVPAPLWTILTQTPDFLVPIPFPMPDVRLYEIRI